MNTPETANPDDFAPDAGEYTGQQLEKILTSLIGSEALAKACVDPFDYALKLRTGEVIRFERARMLDPRWIHLSLGDWEQDAVKILPYKADRGVDIRVADIVWVMDAPEGS
jgi:hypothetical protein